MAVMSPAPAALRTTSVKPHPPFVRRCTEVESSRIGTHSEPIALLSAINILDEESSSSCLPIVEPNEFVIGCSTAAFERSSYLPPGVVAIKALAVAIELSVTGMTISITTSADLSLPKKM